MPEQTLHDAITELRSAITALHELIDREYPRRSELERDFTSRQTSQKRWLLVVALLPISLIISYFASVTTISTCFLGKIEVGSKPPAVCRVIPGYTASIERNNLLIEQFERLISITENNERRIKKLEKGQS